LALGVIVTVADPTEGVKDGILVTPVWSASPTPAPPVISKTTPEGVPDNMMADVAVPEQ
jgi:hypothetical protein